MILRFLVLWFDIQYFEPSDLRLLTSNSMPCAFPNPQSAFRNLLSPWLILLFDICYYMNTIE
jgi:hypothetical protein